MEKVEACMRLALEEFALHHVKHELGDVWEDLCPPTPWDLKQVANVIDKMWVSIFTHTQLGSRHQGGGKQRLEDIQSLHERFQKLKSDNEAPSSAVAQLVATCSKILSTIHSPHHTQLMACARDQGFLSKPDPAKQQKVTNPSSQFSDRTFAVVDSNPLHTVASSPPKHEVVRTQVLADDLTMEDQSPIQELAHFPRRATDQSESMELDIEESQEGHPTVEVGRSGVPIRFVVDGANVGWDFGKGSNFDPTGILVIVNYLQHHQYRCIVFLPRSYMRDSLTQLHESGVLVLTPAKDYDDAYIIKFSMDKDAIVISNDMFRDFIEQEIEPDANKALAEWIRAHTMSYTFVDGTFFPNPLFVAPAPAIS